MRCTMTNREWLNSLTDEELTHWLYDEQSEIIGYKKEKGFMNCREIVYVDMPIYDKLYPRFHEIGRGWTSASGRFAQWIKEERQEGVFIE